MHIKWTFAYENSHIAVAVKDETEDQRILDAVSACVDLLEVEANGNEVWINLKYCKAIIREEVNEEKPPEEAKPDESIAG